MPRLIWIVQAIVAFCLPNILIVFVVFSQLRMSTTHTHMCHRHTVASSDILERFGKPQLEAATV